MCKQHALRIAWTIARSIAFLDFRVLRWKFTYDWKCVNTTYRVPLFCPLPASRKGLRLTLRSALFGEGGRDWRPWYIIIWNKGKLQAYPSSLEADTKLHLDSMRWNVSGVYPNANPNVWLPSKTWRTSLYLGQVFLKLTYPCQENSEDLYPRVHLWLCVLVFGVS